MFRAMRGSCAEEGGASPPEPPGQPLPETKFPVVRRLVLAGAHVDRPPDQVFPKQDPVAFAAVLPDEPHKFRAVVTGSPGGRGPVLRPELEDAIPTLPG